MSSIRRRLLQNDQELEQAGCGGDEEQVVRKLGGHFSFPWVSSLLESVELVLSSLGGSFLVLFPSCWARRLGVSLQWTILALYTANPCPLLVVEPFTTCLSIIDDTTGKYLPFSVDN